MLIAIAVIGWGVAVLFGFLLLTADREIFRLQCIIAAHETRIADEAITHQVKRMAEWSQGVVAANTL